MLPLAGAGRPQGEKGGKEGGASSKEKGNSSKGEGVDDDEDVYDLRCVLYHKGSNVHSGHIVAEVRVGVGSLVVVVAVFLMVAALSRGRGSRACFCLNCAKPSCSRLGTYL